MTIKQQGGIFGRNPSFNEVEVSDLTVTDVTVTDEILFQGYSTGKVEQSKSSGREVLELRSSSSGLGGGSGINLYGDGDSSFPDHVRIWGSSEAVRIDDSNNTGIYGNLIIKTSGKGIDFSATSGTGTSELFDDYEEGTWTPDVQDTSGNSASTSSAAGTYTKVGDVVTAFMRIVDVNKSGLTSGDAIRVYGLPYTSAGTTRYGGSAIINTWTGTTGLITQVIGGNAFVQFKTPDNGNALVSEITSGSADIYSQVTYKV